MKRLMYSFSFACLLPCFGAAADNAAGEARELFNGRDLEGWEVVVGDEGIVEDQKLFEVADGLLHVYKEAEDGAEQPFGYLLTTDEYSDYRLVLEYKWGAKKFPPRGGFDDVRDAGVCYHVQGPFVIWPTSVECQIQEGDTGDIWAINARVTSTVHPANMNYWTPENGGVEITKGDVPKGYQRFIRSYCYEQPGWNRIELIVRGDSATYLINGHVANRVTKMKHWDEATASWQPLTKGRILLQAEGAELFYRNIAIMPLEPSIAAAR